MHTKQQKQNNMKATYTNKATNEVYIINGISSLKQAWNISEFVCKRNNWNHSMFCNDVKVKISK